MMCDRYRSMLHLYRNGELSNREAGDLVQHLHACESCRLEYERIARVETVVSRMRSFTPTVENPQALTRAILEKVRSSHELQSSGLLDTALDFFGMPGVRIATVSFILLVTGLFLFQYATLFSDIHALETTAGVRSMSSSHPGILYSVESSEAVRLAQSKDFQKLIPPGQFRIVEGQLLVPQNNVSGLLSTYGLRSITSFVASSVLRVDQRKVDAIIDHVSKNYTTVIGYEH